MHALLLGLIGGLVAGRVGWHALWGALCAAAFVAMLLPLAAAVAVWSHPALGPLARQRAWRLLPALAMVGAAALAIGPRAQIVALGCAGGGLGAAYLAVRRRWGPRSAGAELAAIAAIGLVGPLAWILVGGASARWYLAAPAMFLAAGGTVPYVRERVRRRPVRDLRLRRRVRRGAPALLWQAAALALTGIAVSAGVVGPLTVVAFAPGAIATLAGIVAPERRPPIRRIGYGQTAIATAFAVLAGLALAGAGAGPR